MALPPRAKRAGSKISLDEGSSQARRRLLECLLGSPLLTFGGLHRVLANTPESSSPEPSSLMYADFLQSLSQGDEAITHVQSALNVFDFDTVARQKLSPAHYGYLATGTDNDATVRANRAGFEGFQLRARRLTGLEQVDTSVQLFDESWETPIALSPIGNENAFHPDGALAVASAARKQRQDDEIARARSGHGALLFWDEMPLMT